MPGRLLSVSNAFHALRQAARLQQEAGDAQPCGEALVLTMQITWYALNCQAGFGDEARTAYAYSEAPRAQDEDDDDAEEVRLAPFGR